MDKLQNELELARSAYDHAFEARSAFGDLVNSIGMDEKSRTLDDWLVAFMNTMTETETLLKRKIEDRKKKWDGVSVLEAVVRIGDETRKIVVAKPNDRIDEPFVTEGFFNAMIAKHPENTEVTTDEEYDIIVVNRKGRPVKCIASNKIRN